MICTTVFSDRHPELVSGSRFTRDAELNSA